MTETAPTQTEALVRQEGAKVEEVLKVAEQAVVKTDEQYVSAKELRKAANSYIKNMDTMEKSATKDLLKGVETIRSWFRPYRAIAKKAKEILDGKITTLEGERERLRLAEEAKLRDKARAEEQKLRDQADKLRASGKEVQAQAKEEVAANVVAPAVMPTLPKVEGSYHREEWDIEIMDAKLIPVEYMVVDEQKIKRMVKAMDGKIEIPGVRNFKRRIQASRAT